MKNQQQAAIGIPLGAVLVTAAAVLAIRHLIGSVTFAILFFAGYIIYLVGCAAWARSKGYTSGQGILLGIAFPPALLLMLLRDRTKMSRAERDEEDREETAEEARDAARRELKGGKKVFVFLMGLLFIAIGVAMIVGSEIYWLRVSVPKRKSLTSAITIDSSKLDPGNDGKLIYTTATLAGGEKLTDPEFGVTVNALRLRRSVWMYQWQDMGSGSKSSYSSDGTTYLKTQRRNYVKVWSERILGPKGPLYDARVMVHVPGTPIDVKALGSGHENPSTKAIPDRSIDADKITLGVFTVVPELVKQIDNFQTVPVDDNNLAAIAEPLRPMAKLLGDEIYFGTNADHPAIGDLKIKFDSAPPAIASIIAQQSGNSLVPYPTANGGSLALLRIGTHLIAEMTAQFEKDQSAERMICWGMACVLILIGTVLIKQPGQRTKKH